MKLNDAVYMNLNHEIGTPEPGALADIGDVSIEIVCELNRASHGHKLRDDCDPEKGFCYSSWIGISTASANSEFEFSGSSSASCPQYSFARVS